MAKQKSSSQSNTGKQGKKKLIKRQEKLEKRLEKAQESYTSQANQLQRLQARIEKKAQRVQRLRTKLMAIQQELTDQKGPHISSPTLQTSASPNQSQKAFEQIPAEAPDEEQQQLHVVIQTNQSSQEPKKPAQAVNTAAHQRAVEARMIAKKAEEAAQEAILRAHNAEKQVVQADFARHLLTELNELQQEAEQAQIQALEAELAAEVAEQQVVEHPIANYIYLHEDIDHKHQENKQPEDEERNMQFEDDKSAMLRLNEEEETVESVAASILANLAAEEVVRAEEEAEEKSVQARELRDLVKQSEETLEQIRKAIADGSLTADAAQQALKVANAEVEQARQLLEGAEVGEEQALQAVINAQAEADVTAGMAHSADQQLARTEDLLAHTQDIQSEDHTQQVSQKSDSEPESSHDNSDQEAGSQAEFQTMQPVSLLAPLDREGYQHSLESHTSKNEIIEPQHGNQSELRNLEEAVLETAREQREEIEREQISSDVESNIEALGDRQKKHQAGI